MKTLDRYIIRQFLINFALLFVVVMLLFIVVDLIVDLDEFVEAGDAHQGDWYGLPLLATLATVIDYYWPIVLLVYVFFNGLIVVGAMGFTVVGLQRHRELTAVIASGVSLYRVAAPLLIAGAVLSGITLPVQEFVLPDLAPKLVRSKSQLSKPQQGLETKGIYYAQASGGDLLSAARYNADEERLSAVRILSRDEQGQTRLVITADAAVWDAEQQAWLLENGRAERPRERGGASAAGPTLRGVSAYQTDLSPTVLSARKNALYASLLSIRTLESLSNSEAVDAGQREKMTQIISSRFSLMLLNVLVLVMGLPFFLKRLPGDTLVSSLRAAGLCLGAWGGGLMMLQMSPGLIPLAGPGLVAWLPVVIYLPVAAWLLQRIES
jgi:lipopolysaccharide export system permease protein